ncbi:MAG TPA: MFS transporter [Firmicutes bacterium]|nr:MFS transporter [Bacillota bacterium]
MATILLIVIYIDFIGLGIPDSLFGAAWPAIYSEFGLPISYASFVTIIIYGGTVVSSLLSARVINRFGTAKVTAVSTALTAAGLLGFSFSGGLIWLCLFAVPLGLGAGAIDSGLNNYIALHYKATHMSFLHCAYGVGVTLSPYLMALALSDNNNWRGGYRIAFFIQIGITAVTILSIPLWGRIRHINTHEEESVKPRTLKLTELIKQPPVRAVCLIFFASCAIEFICGSWGSTFLVQSKGMSAESAAKIITFYYAGIALGRFLSGILAAKLPSWRIIHIGQAAIITAVVLLALPLPFYVAAAGLFLVGLGNGPIYPNLVHLTPQNFGRDISQSVMGAQMASASIGIMLMPTIFGLFAQGISTDIFPYFLLVMFIVMIASTAVLVKNLKADSRYNV